MVEFAHRAPHYLDDLGMAVADNGAHLAGAEIENPPPVGIPHEAALGTLDDEGCEIAPVAHQMGVRLLPEHRVGITASGFAHIVHAALLGPVLSRDHNTRIPPSYRGLSATSSSLGALTMRRDGRASLGSSLVEDCRQAIMGTARSERVRGKRGKSRVSSWGRHRRNLYRLC